MTDQWEQELRRTFLEEAQQLLSDAEQCFLELEQGGTDATLMEKIFRLAHNLKGSAGAAGFHQIADFTHHFESLILRIKKGERPVNGASVGLLLRCHDYLAGAIARLSVDPHASALDSALNEELERAASGVAVEGDFGRTQALASGSPAVSFVVFQESEHGDKPSQDQGEVASPRRAAPPALPGNGKTKPENAGDAAIRVSAARLDGLMNDVGELVILQAVLSQHRHEITSPLLQRTITQLAKITKNIQDTSMSLRMVSLKQTFLKLQRIARDTSAALGKKVRLITEGDDVELDKSVLDGIGDPLVHLVRNAIDHGIESSAERLASGKEEQGTVRLSARHANGQIVIEIADDGRGLEARSLVRKAIEKGIIPPSSDLADAEALRLIFAPGFSTRDEVTDISGRGVGMDVVKTNIEMLQGEVQVQSTPGSGASFQLLLPLTLAIIDGFVVTVGSERYVVPLSCVHESFKPQAHEVSSVKGRTELLNVRGETLPMLRLSRLMGGTQQERAATDSIAIISRDGMGHAAAVLVDDIVAQQQVVIKRLGEGVHGLPGIGGAAVLGDGRAALIVDVLDLLKHRKEAA